MSASLVDTFSAFPWADVRGDEYSGCVFGREPSPEGSPLHRYALWRTWDADAPMLCVVGANPSKATHEVSDTTITRFVGWAQRWSPSVAADHAHTETAKNYTDRFGGLLMLNRCGYRSTDPKPLRSMGRLLAEGLDNDAAIRAALGVLDSNVTHVRIVLAWGDCMPDTRRKVVIPTGANIDFLLREAGRTAWCFGRTRNGNPRHPVRLAYTTPLERWT
jgi:hypothetical protein